MIDLGFLPVFIMGHHRSGTTILYKVLAETGLFNVTTAYHVLNRTRLLEIHASGGEATARAELERLFESRGLKDREFDSMPISPDLPEEYAWALRNQGRRPRLDAGNRESFVQFCRDVTACQRPGRPLLLKNPFDVANFPYIARTFPTAHFVYIHRNPVDVVNSQVKAVRSVLFQKNEYVALVVRRYRSLYEHPAKLALARFLYSDSWPLLVLQVARTVARANDHFLRRGAELGGRAVSVTYEQLCTTPARTIKQILDSLGKSDESSLDYDALIRPRETALVPGVLRRRPKIRSRNAQYCRAFGF